jgi:transcriptional regulator with XRE-family HTH domain
MTSPPVGPNLRRLRKDRQLTVKVAADELGVAERTLHKWERSESQPSWMYLERLSEFYETTPAERRIVHNLLMEAAVPARRHVLAPTVAADSNGQAAAFAAACEAVATRLSNP